MTLRNDQILRRFYLGESGLKNHTGTMQTIEVSDSTLLVGFDNCIYAHRSPDGIVTKYTGWAEDDTSTTTMRHIDAIEADHVREKKPQILSWEAGTIRHDGVPEIENLE